MFLLYFIKVLITNILRNTSSTVTGLSLFSIYELYLISSPKSLFSGFPFFHILMFHCASNPAPADDGPSAWFLVTHTGELHGASGSCFWPAPATAVVFIWAMNQQLKTFHCHCAFQISLKNLYGNSKIWSHLLIYSVSIYIHECPAACLTIWVCLCVRFIWRTVAIIHGSGWRSLPPNAFLPGHCFLNCPPFCLESNY